MYQFVLLKDVRPHTARALDEHLFFAKVVPEMKKPGFQVDFALAREIV
jgi:hypothetical protein